MNDYYGKDLAGNEIVLENTEPMRVHIENLQIQLMSERKMKEAFREDAREHREMVAVLKNEVKALKSMLKKAVDNCAYCCNMGKLKDHCQFCRRFTGIGEDMWEV